MTLYAWQEECLDIWLNNGCKGIVNVVTGAGKTALAAAAAGRLSGIDGLRVKIVVPKTFLVRQWSLALREYLSIPREDIGVYSGARKSAPDKKFMIYVINSARYSLARHILDDLSASRPVFLIADECHHYGTEENAKIFDFYPWRQPGAVSAAPTADVYTLGLSATPYCEHYEDVLVPCLGREIFRFSFGSALSAGIINHFAVFYISLRFNADERQLYDEFTDKITKILAKLHQYAPYIGGRGSPAFFREIRRLTGTGGAAAELARGLLLLTYRRKGIVCNAAARVRCVLDLVRLLRRDARIIIFGERIELADKIYKGISGIFPNEAGIYHSGIHSSVGEAALKRFEHGGNRILVSCRTLDEGLSVTGADVGIIVSSTNSGRQRVQRLGRVLRKKQSGRPAYLYYLYIDGTTEETDVFRDCASGAEGKIPFIDLYYDDETGSFSNPYYSRLAALAASRAGETGWDGPTMSELRKNLERGTITCDWWLTEAECREHIKKAKDRRERNYYAAMLCLIRERK